MKNLIPLYFLALVLMAGCTFKKTVKVAETNFKEEVARNQELVFTFSMPVAADSLLNIWDTVKYLDFEPPVQGRFKWTADNTLLFSAAELLNPCCDFKASLNTKNLSLAGGKRLSVSSQTFSFHTPYLALMSANASWMMNENAGYSVGIRIRLQFNNAVDPGLLSNLLKVIIAEKDVFFTLSGPAVGESQEILIAEPEQSDSDDISIHIRISPGLGCGICGWQSDETIDKVLTLPPKEQLQVREMQGYFEGGYGVISIFTSQPLVAENLADLVTVEPYIDLKVEPAKEGFLLKGNFSEGQTYKVTLSGDIKGVFGKTIGKTYTQYVTFGDLEPNIAFTDKAGRYLSLKGNRNVGVQIINVPKIRISIFKIFENNIQHYMREGKSYEWEYANDQYYNFYDYGFREDYGQTIFSKVIETSTLPKNGNIRLLNINTDAIDLSNLLKGIYLIKVESIDNSWLKDVQLFAVSDLGLIVRSGKKDILVYVNSIRDATPVTGVQVNFMSSNNQLVYTMTTDKQGIAHLKDVDANIPGFVITMITAHKDNDFNYILLSESMVETSRFDVGGKRTAGLIYDVFLYGGRDIYRPGDTVYFNTIVRTMDWKTERDIPVKIRVVRPDGREFLAFRKTLDSQGSAGSHFSLPYDAMTGAYVIEVYSGNDVLLKSSRILVEEFLPDRIKVTALADKQEYRSQEDIKLDINAMNLFGTPAANRNYETELQISQKRFTPKEFPDYTFEIILTKDRSFENVTREGSTDDQGNATEVFQAAGFKDIGILQGNIFTTVFDETGRPVNRLTQVDILTQNLFFGIKQFDRWVGTRKPLDIGLIAVDKNGKKVSSASARVQIVQFTYETVIEHTGYSYNYKSERVEHVILDKTLTIDDGVTTYTYTPGASGSYEIRIMASGSEGYVAQEFYAYGWGDTDYTSFEVNREGQITIEADKQEYRPGQTARLLFKTPFDGKLLITVERDDVMESHVVTTSNKAASINLMIKEEYLPNIYITATAFRPHKGNDLPLTVAHGFASLKVMDPDSRLSLDINAADETRSKKRQEVVIKTDPGAEMTVAIVDEGILQVTGFLTPNPLDYFFQKRALEVTASDIYGLLYPELGTNLSKTGGDIGLKLGKFISPVTGKRARLLAWWSGILKADAKGECRFSFDIPQFSGSLRIMAVAYDNEKFAAAEKNIRVADPVIISTALPRFLSPGDNALVPVTVTNATGKPTKATVTIETKGPVQPGNESVKTVTLQPNSEQQVLYDIAAGPDVGEAEVNISVEALNERFTDITVIPVRPPAGLSHVTGSGSVTGGDSASINVRTDFLPASAASKLILSKTPTIEFSKHLNDLLNYPYGCSEQLISKAFPLIYFMDLAKMLGQEKKERAYNLEFLVQEVITKIQSLQVDDGGLLLWPGGGEPNWWVTAYGTHFLYEARQAGYAVNDRILNSMFRYLEQKVKEKSTEEYYYPDNNGQ
ncbi:MAG: MG2 domain-containing protein [Bacteroidetes bacterium]|nr:MG2 domain-containing protein [Bacteroidota bacterium]